MSDNHVQKNMELDLSMLHLFLHCMTTIAQASGLPTTFYGHMV